MDTQKPVSENFQAYPLMESLFQFADTMGKDMLISIINGFFISITRYENGILVQDCELVFSQDIE